MTPATETGQSVVLYPLSIGELEDGAAEVGRPETGVFVSLPEQGIELIRDMQQGLNLAEVSARFTQRYGQAPDLEDFIGALTECGFVRQVGDRYPSEPGDADQATGPAEPQMRGWRLLSSLPADRVAWTVSKPALVACALAWIAMPVILAVRPDLIPRGKDGLLGLGVTGDAIGLTILTWALLLGHEMAHMVAVRARGCTGVLRISHRLHLLVAETDMSSVRSLPRSQRYAPYLAGMTFTLAVFLLCLVARLAGMNAQPVPAIAFLCAVTLMLELAVFMRTDVYYVMVTWLRLGNLMGDTWHFIANQLARVLRKPQPYDLSAIPARELRIVRWYSAFMLAGVLVFVGQFLLLGVPLLLSFITNTVSGLGGGPAKLGFWDSVALLALAAAHFGTLGFVAVQRRLHPVTEVTRLSDRIVCDFPAPVAPQTNTCRVQRSERDGQCPGGEAVLVEHRTQDDRAISTGIPAPGQGRSPHRFPLPELPSPSATHSRPVRMLASKPAEPAVFPRRQRERGNRRPGHPRAGRIQVLAPARRAARSSPMTRIEEQPPARPPAANRSRQVPGCATAQSWRIA